MGRRYRTKFLTAMWFGCGTLLLGAGSVRGVQSRPAVSEKSEQDGVAVIALFIVGDANTAAHEAYADAEAPRQRIAELMADMDTVTVSRIYRRLAEETLRGRTRERGHEMVVQYVYLPAAGEELLRIKGNRQVSPDSDSARTVRLDYGEFLETLHPDTSDRLVVEMVSRLVDRMRGEEGAGIGVSYEDINSPHAQSSQTAVPEPATVALVAIGAAIAFRRRKSGAGRAGN